MTAASRIDVPAAGVDDGAWDAFVEASDPGSYLQLGGWARVKAVNGWSAVRLRDEAAGVGAQVLVRRPRPLPWGFAYAPRGPVATAWTPDAIRAFTQRCTDVLEMYVRRYPDLWLWMHRRWRDVEGVK